MRGDNYPYEITFVGDRIEQHFNHKGMFGEQENLFDITSIIEPPFDWGTVKPGNAFIWEGKEEIVHYIGPNLNDKELAWFETKYKKPCEFSKCKLIRTPEHDKDAP